MVDFDALEAAGIADARRRAPLIEYLAGLGFTAEEMVDAERRGRLFGLAGDVLQWSGPPTYSLAAAAETLGLPIADVQRAWAALGLTVAGLDVPVLSQADVDGLATWAEMRAVVGEEAATGLLRVIGSGMARQSEAISSIVRAGSPMSSSTTRTTSSPPRGPTGRPRHSYRASARWRTRCTGIT